MTALASPVAAKKPARRALTAVLSLGCLFALAACGGGGGGGGAGLDPDAGIAPDLPLQGAPSIELSPSLDIVLAADLALPIFDANLVQLILGSARVPSLVTAAARLIALRPELPLLPATEYEVVILPGLAFADGRKLTRAYRWKLKTREVKPQDPPIFVRSDPAQSSSVAPRASFALTFDKPLASDSVTPASAGLLTAGGQPIAAATSLSQDKLTIEVKTAEALPLGTYRIFATTAVKSTLGRPLAKDIDLAFAIRDGFYALGSEPGNNTTTGIGLLMVKVNFNRNVDSPSFGSGFKLTRNDVVVPGYPFVSGKVGVYALAAPLNDAGEYKIRVQGVKDSEQKLQGADFASTFRIDLGNTAWSAPQELTLDGFANPTSLEMSLASSPNGHAALVWMERDRSGPQYNLLVSVNDGATWSAPLPIEDSLQATYFPRVAVNDAGVVLVTWTQYDSAQRKYLWYARARKAGAWGLTQPLVDFAEVSAVHVGASGDIGILGEGVSGVRAVEQIGGAWRGSYVLQGSSDSKFHQPGEEVWSTDDAGRRLVIFSAKPASSYAMFAALFTDGQGWSTQKLADAYFSEIELLHVTPSGDAVVVWSGSLGTSYGSFLQCRRGGAWLAAPQALGQLENSARFLAGSSGNTLLLTTKVDENRTRAFARLFRLSSGAFDTGAFLDDTAVTSTAIMNLVGSPDLTAQALYYRSRTTGPLIAKNTWTGSASTWDAWSEFAADTHSDARAAWDRSGNGVLIDTHTGIRYRQGTGFTDERSDPNSSPIYFSSRFGGIYGVGRRIEYRNSQSYEYLRITSYR